MTLNKFNLPDVGEGLTEAEIVSWKVKPGDTVAINDVICEIETAKSIVELPSPFAGTVNELLVEVSSAHPRPPSLPVPPPSRSTARCPQTQGRRARPPPHPWWVPGRRPMPSSAGPGRPHRQPP